MSSDQDPVRPEWNGYDKYSLLSSISLGFFAMWFVAGIPLSFYVRFQTEDLASKSSYCQMTFWLMGLALFFMWLLWFSMYAAQLNP